MIKKELKILQWNVLADCLAGGNVDLGGFDDISFDVLDIKLRLPKIIDFIIDANPDLISLQEVDFYDQLKEPIENVLNMNSVFVPTKGKKHGNVLFWKGYFSKNDIKSINLGNTNQTFVSVSLNDSNWFGDFVFCTTHLKADKTPEGDAIRVKQMNEILKQISKDDKVIFSGDFNANPESECVKMLLENGGFKSAAIDANSSEFPYTTIKSRAGKKVKHTIDYIFVNNKFKVINCGLLNYDCTNGDTLLPNIDYPSDHFCLIATIQ